VPIVTNDEGCTLYLPPGVTVCTSTQGNLAAAGEDDGSGSIQDVLQQQPHLRLAVHIVHHQQHAGQLCCVTERPAHSGWRAFAAFGARQIADGVFEQLKGTGC
jgi:hypothetical protein